MVVAALLISAVLGSSMVQEHEVTSLLGMKFNSMEDEKGVIAEAKAKLDAEEYKTWIEPLRPVSADAGVVELAVPNRMFASWVESNFLDELAALVVHGRPGRFCRGQGSPRKVNIPRLAFRFPHTSDTSPSRS